MNKSLFDERNELLEAVKAPERKKKSPSNAALYFALIFANVIFLILDIVSGFTVYWMTKLEIYGILTILAGYVPLLMHEFLFKRAFANETQKRIAIVGGVTSILSIFLIGLLAGYVNLAGVGSMSRTGTEYTTIAVLILIATFHAILAIVYFYLDSGIQAEQQTAQAVARATHQGTVLGAGDYILTLTQKSVEKRRQLTERHNGPALAEVLRQLGQDENGDGIPDVLQRGGGGGQQQRMQQFASKTQQPNLRNEGDERPNE